ncbi:uncharacterized protein EI97DRAFT_205544 [Westerdykella ornata]|uniref:Uncharacterized protein n=1 Tax=Westerdykella ornata TaxID=318751 RepID=A0A6A6J7Q0_WESOR|nr:uncharacterized protein EI97DRAFT_205544 [Westerdykella ornata]KAF2272571.1 hypothetical protein EI97DRAFT_205544 [Westerdykella ornata]
MNRGSSGGECSDIRSLRSPAMWLGAGHEPQNIKPSVHGAGVQTGIDRLQPVTIIISLLLLQSFHVDVQLHPSRHPTLRTAQVLSAPGRAALNTSSAVNCHICQSFRDRGRQVFPCRRRPRYCTVRTWTSAWVPVCKSWNALGVCNFVGVQRLVRVAVVRNHLDHLDRKIIFAVGNQGQTNLRETRSQLHYESPITKQAAVGQGQLPVLARLLCIREGWGWGNQGCSGKHGVYHVDAGVHQEACRELVAVKCVLNQVY